MRRLGFTSDAGYRFERGVDFDGCARARRARDAADRSKSAAAAPGPLTDAVPTPICRAAIPSACAARASPGCSASRFPPTRSPMRSRASASRSTREATTSSSRRRRGASTSRSRKISSRKSRASTATTRSRRRPRTHVQQMLPDPEGAAFARRRQAHARRPRLAGGHHLRLRLVGTRSGARSGAQVRSRVAQSDRRPARRHAHDAAARPASRCCTTNLNRKAPRVRIFELGRTFRRAGRRLRAAGAARRPRLRPGRTRSNGAKRRATSTSSTSRATSRRSPRRVTWLTRGRAHPALHPGRCRRSRRRTTGRRLDRRAASAPDPRLRAARRLPWSSNGSRRLLTDGCAAGGLAVSRLPDRAPGPGHRRRRKHRQPGYLLDALKARSLPPSMRCRLFDVYRGPRPRPGRKSLAILVLMQDTSRTLTDADIDAIVALLLP